MAASYSKLSQPPYAQNNNKTIILTIFLKPLTWKKGRISGWTERLIQYQRFK